MKFGSYLVCHGFFSQVKDFLSFFLVPIEDQYSHDAWCTFLYPKTAVKVNLMRGETMPITQNMVFEVYAESRRELESFAKRYGKQIQTIHVNDVSPAYDYFFLSIEGPGKICGVEVSYMEYMEEEIKKPTHYDSPAMAM